MATFNRLTLGTAALAAAAAVAVAAQDKPESILPPGFGQPTAPQPAPSAAPPTAPTARPTAPTTTPDGAATGDTTAPVPSPSESPSPDASGTPVPYEYTLPDYARRSLDQIGFVGSDLLPADAFGRADGRFIEGVMRRINAPVASRWLSIALRRTLLSALRTPAAVNGADFAAERAWLLVRMGEAAAARAVVQDVDAENATPKLIQATMQAALATGDPAALCPYAETGLAQTHEAGWVLARAMCLALSGKPGEAGAAIDAARRRGIGRGIDLSLAEKVVGAGAQGRRAVTIEWPGVDGLTAWRWGLSAATGVEVPEDMMATAGPQVRYWHALAPIYPATARAADAERAAAQGVLSNLALVDLYGYIDDTDDGSSPASAVARDLRTAYVAPSAEERLTALKGLWDAPESMRGKFARLVLTARAAARIQPKDGKGEADRLIAAMLSAGLQANAERWTATVKRGSDGWAMLLLANPAGGTVRTSDISAYDGNASKEAIFFAGMAGLGHLSERDITGRAAHYGIDLGYSDAWTRAVDAAARARQPGTVVLLCAAGMQTSDWRGVSPAALYRMVAALRATGLEGYARMIAAEAIARLPA